MAEADMKKVRDKAQEGFHEVTEAAVDATQRAAGAVDDNVRAFAEMSADLTSAFQEISREWWSLAQNRLKTNLELSNKLLNCRTVPETLSVQGELAKSNLEQFLNDSRRLMDLSIKAMSKVASQAEANRDARRAA
jgi:hypothetical protein